jgi:hypothetical protein
MYLSPVPACVNSALSCDIPSIFPTDIATQILSETKKFSKPFSLTVTAVFGGMNKYEQCKALKAGGEVVVATPGRLIDMVRLRALDFRRCSYLVLDEADRMFSMGFELQVRRHATLHHATPLRSPSGVNWHVVFAPFLFSFFCCNFAVPSAFFRAVSRQCSFAPCRGVPAHGPGPATRRCVRS